jgi:hypothetical protein
MSVVPNLTVQTSKRRTLFLNISESKANGDGIWENCRRAACAPERRRQLRVDGASRRLASLLELAAAAHNG